jgi:hypothetical protein
VLSSEDVSARSPFPLVGRVACEVESEARDAENRKLLRVNTSRPYSIESTSGDTVFELAAEQILL